MIHKVDDRLELGDAVYGGVVLEDTVSEKRVFIDRYSIMALVRALQCFFETGEFTRGAGESCKVCGVAFADYGLVEGGQWICEDCCDWAYGYWM